jgi:hypothetical protein
VDETLIAVLGHSVSDFLAAVLADRVAQIVALMDGHVVIMRYRLFVVNSQ